MAEINQNGANHSGGKTRAKKQSTKIDMTPMVDLAFLLLTFFILTTSFNEGYVLRITMPENEQDPALRPPINDKNVLNVVLAENNKVYWWIGLDSKSEQTNYSHEGIRKILLAKSEANPDLMVLIKPHDNAKYENMIDILDEMEITGMQRYAIVDFTEDDKVKIAGELP